MRKIFTMIMVLASLSVTAQRAAEPSANKDTLFVFDPILMPHFEAMWNAVPDTVEKRPVLVLKPKLVRKEEL
jgi:hypothetical protein